MDVTRTRHASFPGSAWREGGGVVFPPSGKDLISSETGDATARLYLGRESMEGIGWISLPFVATYETVYFTEMV